MSTVTEPDDDRPNVLDLPRPNAFVRLYDQTRVGTLAEEVAGPSGETHDHDAVAEAIRSLTPVRTIAHMGPVSREVIEGEPGISIVPDFEHNTIAIRVEIPRPPTPEETRLYEERLARRAAARDALVEALRATGPVSALLVDLHVPNEYHECVGCGGGDDAPWWPCPTIDLLREHYKIEANLDVL